MSFSIRQATLTDLPVLQQLNHGLFEFSYPDHDDILLQNWSVSPPGTVYFTKTLTDPLFVVFLAINVTNQPLGYIIGSAHNKYTYRTKVTGELDNMFILPQARGQGVGKALVLKLKEWLKNKGVGRMYVSAYWKNKFAIGFYKAVGFSEIDIGLEMKL